MLREISLAPRAPLQDVDLWTPVPCDDLPVEMVNAMAQHDWKTVRTELSSVMDGVTTDGKYGRELLQLILRLPIGVDPVFDRYRAMVSIDFGDWDGLRACLAAAPIAPAEIVGLRDIVLAPLDRTIIPDATEAHHTAFFEANEYMLSQLLGRQRRFVHRLRVFRPTGLYWSRPDIPVSRHVRYRELHDALNVAVAEALAGRLPIALVEAHEAQHLGDPGEPYRTVAHDLEQLIGAVTGDPSEPEMLSFEMFSRATGPSPFGTWQMLTYLMPLAVAAEVASLQWAGRLLEHAAAGIASPRAHFQADSWSAAIEFVKGTPGSRRRVDALVAQARQAGPGLRVLPLLLRARSTGEYVHFVEAERLARRVGNVWAQVAALTWMVAIDPSRLHARRLARLLEMTGWRRPPLTPAHIAAEAALGLTTTGLRGRSVIELAAVGGRPNVALDVARRHAEDLSVALDVRLAAVDALAALGTTHALEFLRRVAIGKDEIGQRARMVLARPTQPLGLSEREVEVVELAGRGKTNREIAAELHLSPHTVARHVANARARLGAANRTEAASRLATSRLH